MVKRPSLSGWPGALVLLLFLAAAPSFLPVYWVFLGTEILIMGLFAMSFNLLFGYTGLLSFGQAGLLGVGAYTAALLMTHGVTSLWLVLLASVGAAAVTALLVGFLCVRRDEIFFAMLSLALGMMLFTVAHNWREVTGGSDGLPVFSVPPVVLGPWKVSLFAPASAYYFVLFWAVAGALFLWAVVRSPFGLILKAGRSAGGVRHGGSPGGPGGLPSLPLQPHGDSGHAPLEFFRTAGSHDHPGWCRHVPGAGGGSGHLLRAGTLGHHLYGKLDDRAGSHPHPRGSLFPGRHLGHAAPRLPQPEAERPMKQRPILSVEDVHHSFGKFAALSGVSLQVPEGRLTALIGPNGAGKTTFYNVVSGRYRPSRGKVRFRGRDVTGLPPHRVCARGLARSFQITNIFERLTVLENVLVPLVVKNGGTFCFWRRLKGDKALERAALEVLAMVGLEDKAHLDVHELPYGDKRLVEMAIVLAGRPQMVLLDEPTAGMNPEETDHMIRLIKSLAETSGTTFFITEHDMKVVFSVADYIYVLHQGKLLAEGTPEQIRADRRVKEAYLGGTSEP